MALCSNRWNSKPGTFTRREMLHRAGNGFGMVALASLLQEQGLLAGEESPLSPRASHQAGKAKSVIWLFMEGGPSGFDLFDPKSELDKSDGKQLPGVDPFFGKPGPLMKSPYSFKRHGESGTWVADVMPHIADCVDDLALLKAVTCQSNSHAPAMYQMNTGFTRPGMPSAGAWANYGLGSLNQDLPGFVVMPKENGTKGGAANWSAGFLPGAYQGTLFRGGAQPILNLARAKGLSQSQQRAQLNLAREWNEEHARRHPEERDLEARIASFELAYRMQFEAAEAVDLSRESSATRNLYGLEHRHTRDFGTKCLLARRLVERGVRFLQLYPNEQWDAHDNLKENHDQMCARTDQPIAGLLKDLKQRGLLESTLVIWGGEFGRLPVAQKGRGRDHNPYGFLMWMAGGGIKGGVSHGETDEIGYRAAEGAVTLPDVHATILNQLGLDHTLLTKVHNGREFRLTDVSGKVIREIVS